MLAQPKLSAEAVSVLAAHSQGIDHVAIAVRDLEEAVSFYTGVLGLEVTERRETAGRRSGMKSAVVVGGPVTFVLVQGTSPESQVCRFVEAYGPGVQHVAVRVTHLSKVMASLEARGQKFVTELIRAKGIHQAFTVRDPNSGIMLELIERVGDQEGFSENNVEKLFLQMEASDHY